MSNNNLHPHWLALLKWAEEHPYGRISLVFQDGIPVQAIVPTSDGLGVESVLFSKIVERMAAKK